MDKLDYEIVSMLKQDGRLSNANVSRVLKVSEGTIRRRLKRMTNENIIPQCNDCQTYYKARAVFDKLGRVRFFLKNNER